MMIQVDLMITKQKFMAIILNYGAKMTIQLIFVVANHVFPKNAIKHQRAGQKRYTKSAQKRANRELQEQKEKYSNRVEWGANTFGNFMYSANKRETNH